MSEFDDNKIAYLQMIQGTINRFASTSASFKGFAITLFAGVLAVVFSIGGSHRVVVLALAFVGLVAIAVFDCWYFKMEKRYRRLFDLVINDEHPIDFDLNNDRSIEVKVSEVISSKAVWLFYAILLGVYIVLIGLCAVGRL